MTTKDDHPHRNPALVLAVAAGDGTGETPVSVDLAVELARRNHRTIVLDCAGSLAAPERPAGATPSSSMTDYLSGDAELKDLIEEGPAGVMFVTADDLAADDSVDRRAPVRRYINDLKPLCDFVILNTGMGTSEAVANYVSTCDHTIAVTTTEFDSVANTYGVIKACAQAGHGESVHVMVNRAGSAREAGQVLGKLKDCAKRFLGLDLNCLGWPPEHTDVEDAVEPRSTSRGAPQESAISRYLKAAVSSLERLSSANSLSRPA